MQILVRRLGDEKLEFFKKNFDIVCDKYKLKATKEGYNGDLLFRKEKGNMVIFVSINGDN
jgi:hypothetical protein